MEVIQALLVFVLKRGQHLLQFFRVQVLVLRGTMVLLSRCTGNCSSIWRPRIMASILRVNTLTDASSNNQLATWYCSIGTAKAWVI